jgi:hypothetical protein
MQHVCVLEQCDPVQDLDLGFSKLSGAISEKLTLSLSLFVEIYLHRLWPPNTRAYFTEIQDVNQRVT